MSRGAGASSARSKPPGTIRTRAPRTQARRLMVIPIIHTEADMGTLAPSIRRITIQKLGHRAWKRNVDVIGKVWAAIRNAVPAWKLPWQNVRLYQDGLPRCGREAQIVQELAGAGSPNHQLLLELMKRGATLMGTESPDLLVEEYRQIQRLLAAQNASNGDKIRSHDAVQSRSLLRRRDRYIAARINESLQPGETGILFLGMLHSLESHLAKDIRVTYPIYRPPRIRTRTA